MSAKTNAARLLDRLGISYELREYEVDPEDVSAENVARSIGLPVEQVFKTLCVRGDRNGPCFAVVPGDARLDPKALARLSGDKRVEPVAVRELLDLTGYVRGGVSVLGAKKAFPAFVDDLATLHDVISVSGGRRGLQVLLAPGDFVRATGATVGDISTPKS